jgi:hypothetical protein
MTQQQLERRNFWADFKRGLSGFAPPKQEAATGVTGDIPMIFAEPSPDGGWRPIPGSIRVVNGLQTRINLPGVSVEAQGDGGVTATYHILTPTKGEATPGKPRMDVMRMAVVGGRVAEMSTEVKGVELAPTDLATASVGTGER